MSTFDIWWALIEHDRSGLSPYKRTVSCPENVMNCILAKDWQSLRALEEAAARVNVNYYD